MPAFVREWSVKTKKNPYQRDVSSQRTQEWAELPLHYERSMLCATLTTRTFFFFLFCYATIATSPCNTYPSTTSPYPIRFVWSGLLEKHFFHPMPCATVAMTINNRTKYLYIYDIRVFPFSFVDWSQRFSFRRLLSLCFCGELFDRNNDEKNTDIPFKMRSEWNIDF